jgi:4-pyridoxolactonase
MLKSYYFTLIIRDGSMKAYLLDGGTIMMDKSLILWNYGQGVRVRLPVYSILIVHDEGNLLFDTGFDLTLVEKYLPLMEPLKSKEQTIQEQLRLVGYNLSDIDYVINSHLHFDHCGGNKLFQDATFIVHKEELRHAYVPEPFARPVYFREDFDIRVKYDFVEGDIELFKDVHLLSTPGHSVGHYSLFLDLDKEPIIYTADAAFIPDNIQLKHPMGLHLDPVAMLSSMDKIKRLSKKKEAKILFPHDCEEYLTYKKPPDLYS